MFTIGEVSEIIGISAHTLRYYEKTLESADGMLEYKISAYKEFMNKQGSIG
ncbi:MerR family DNA-binding transcriptional regulator [Paenibacillus sp. CAU 1782]